MTLPRPPISLNTPIPNQPFTSDEVYYLEGNQGHLPLGQGLYIDPRNGEFTNIEPSPYIHCTPQYSNLPVTYPPYGCNTEVNTAGVTDFTEAWRNCEYITEFPCVDSGSVTNFDRAWIYCYSLTSFPTIDTSLGENFTYSWAYTGLTSFPKLNLSNGTSFQGTWAGSYYMESFPDDVDLSKGENFLNAWGYSYEDGLKSFPALDLSSGTNFQGAWEWCQGMVTFGEVDVSKGENFSNAWQNCENLTSSPALNLGSGTNFSYAWCNCTNLTSFPAGMFDSCLATNFLGTWVNCALSQQSVDNILVSLNTAGQSNGTINIDGGTSAAPGAAGLSAKASLESRGWTIITY